LAAGLKHFDLDKRRKSEPASPFSTSSVVNDPDLGHLIQHFEAKSSDFSPDEIAFPTVVPQTLSKFSACHGSVQAATPKCV